MSVLALADRHTNVPRGAKVAESAFRLDYLTADDLRYTEGWLHYGLTKDLELEIAFEDTTSTSLVASPGLSYLVIAPWTGEIPGIAVGVGDLLDDTRLGRHAYVAITFRYWNDGDLQLNTSTELTLGVRTGRSAGAMAAVRLPFTDDFRAMIEHDALGLTGGIEWEFSDGVTLRSLYRRDHALFGVRFFRRL